MYEFPLYFFMIFFHHIMLPLLLILLLCFFFFRFMHAPNHQAKFLLLFNIVTYVAINTFLFLIQVMYTESQIFLSPHFTFHINNLRTTALEFLLKIVLGNTTHTYFSKKISSSVILQNGVMFSAQKTLQHWCRK